MVQTEGHPPCFCTTEEDALAVAETRLPRSSLLLIHRTHVRTRVSAWEPWRGFP